MLLDHRVVLVHVARGEHVPLPGAPCARGEDPSTRLYLTDGAWNDLHHQRRELPAQTLQVGPFEGRRLEVWRTGRVVGVVMVLRAPGPIDSPGLRAALDPTRLRRPLWAGQALPSWSWNGDAYPDLGALLERLLPGARAARDDARLLTLTWTCHPATPSADERFALLAVDPPELPPAPAAVRDRELTRFAWRRWEAAGTWWAFNHYAGSCVTVAEGGQAPTWMGALFEGVYLDLAGWVGLVAAAHSFLGEWGPGSGVFRRRLSEQDQGRALARLWLGAIAEDQDPRRVGE